MEGAVQEEEDRGSPRASSLAPPAQLGPPHLPTLYPPPTLQSTHSPNWPAIQTRFPLANRTPFPHRNTTEGMLLQLRDVGLELTEEELQQWALDTLLSLEDCRWLWELAPALIPSTSPTPPLPHQPWYNASNASLPTTFAPNAQSTFVPSVDWLPPDILSEPATCTPVPYVENSVMWAPVVQLQPQLVHPLPEWVTHGIFESESRGSNRGNVMIEDPPTSFSPFSLVDCTLISHFSFDDFVAVAFPDLTRDLDVQN